MSPSELSEAMAQRLIHCGTCDAPLEVVALPVLEEGQPTRLLELLVCKRCDPWVTEEFTPKPDREALDG